MNKIKSEQARNIAKLTIKDPQFWTNQADIQATLPTHELIILTKFHKDWQEVVDFLVIAKVWASLTFFAPVYIYHTIWNPKK